VALRVSFDHVDAGSATTKRARGYLRWYPSTWRERYGEEFVAHLEIELAERPASFARTTDIVAHGLLARLSFQRGLKIALRAMVAAVLVTGGIVGAITLTRYWSPVTITSGYDGGVAGESTYSSPSNVNDVAFNFSTHSHVAIRITSVKVIPLRGFSAPQLVGVEFAAHFSEDSNGDGWPVRLPKATTVQEGGHTPLIKAIGATVTLARTDVLWLGLRVPSLHHAYAVEEVRVTYELRGVSHTMVIDQATTPDVICSSSSRSTTQTPAWCSREIQAADVSAAYENWHAKTEQPSVEANQVASFALNEVQAAGYGVPTLTDVRHWATEFFPAKDVDGIRSVTGVVNSGLPEWRFVIRSASKHLIVVQCTSRGQVAPGAGATEVGVQTITPVDNKVCPSSTAN
jgi:hypothetical protein